MTPNTIIGTEESTTDPLQKGLLFTKKRIMLFVVLAYAFSWLPWYWLLSHSTTQFQTNFITTMVSAAPVLAALITLLFAEDNPSFSILLPHFKRDNLRVYLVAWFGPSVLVAIGSFLYFCIWPDRFDGTMHVYAAYNDLTAEEVGGAVAKELILGVLFGPLMQLFPSIGEELGWRGYLLPRLRRYLSPRGVILVTGILWGLWHFPVIARGHNYGAEYATAPWGGTAMMVLQCIAMSAFLTWLTVKSESVLPAVLAHSCYNAVASASTCFLAKGIDNPFIGPQPTGAIGGIGILTIGTALLLCAPRWMADKRPGHERIATDDALPAPTLADGTSVEPADTATVAAAEPVPDIIPPAKNETDTE